MSTKNIIVHSPENCDHCGVCVSVCPEIVYRQSDPKAALEIAHPDRCFGCMACEEDCKQGALQIYRLPDTMSMSDLPAPGAELVPDQCYELVIVGAGPAGLGAAIRGRMLGLTVAVLERLPSAKRAHHPDGGVLFSPKDVYTMTVSDAGFRLEELAIDFPRSIIHETLYDFMFMGPEGQRTAPRTTKWDGFIVVDKHGYCETMAQKALQLGATIAYNTRVKAISQPNPDGTRTVTMANGLSVQGKVVISAEGISGQLTHEAGLKVNAEKIGWGFAPYASFPALAKPNLTAGFMVGPGPGKTPDHPIPYLSYLSSGPHATHFATGPMQQSKVRQPTEPSSVILKRLVESDRRVVAVFGDKPDLANVEIDGCRALVRKLPKRLVADSLIGVGDAITTCGMITNVMAVKTGDLAAQAAHKAIAGGDVSAAGLQSYETAIWKLQMYKGMSWMNKLLFEAPLQLPERELNDIYNAMKPLQLGRMQAGELMPLLTFYLGLLPKMIMNKSFRYYFTP